MQYHRFDCFHHLGDYARISEFVHDVCYVDDLIIHDSDWARAERDRLTSGCSKIHATGEFPKAEQVFLSPSAFASLLAMAAIVMIANRRSIIVQSIVSEPKSARPVTLLIRQQ